MPETQSDVNWFKREADGLLPVLRSGPAFAPGGNRSIGASILQATWLRPMVNICSCASLLDIRNSFAILRIHTNS